MGLVGKIKGVVRWANLRSTLWTLKQNPKRFAVDNKAILLDTVSFRFDVNRVDNAPSVVIDAGAMVGCNFIFESDHGKVCIGEKTFVGPRTSLISRESITIGKYVFIAWGCYIYDHNSHSLNWQDRYNDLETQIRDYEDSGNYVLNKDWSHVGSAPIFIEDRAWIGFESVILKGVRIGEGAIVGARSVVTKDVEPWTVVAGNPARIVKMLPENKRN